MGIYQLSITEVTCYGNLYCVAGWDIDNGGMVRPEPADATPDNEASRFWRAYHVGAGRTFAPGNVVRLVASGPPKNFPFPHATEDRIVTRGTPMRVLRRLTPKQLTATAQNSVSNSIQAVFNGHLIRASSEKAYVPAGARTNSLGAIEIKPRQIRFYEEAVASGKRRLRALIDQGGVEYDLSVPADAARTRFLAGGIAALLAEANASNLLHVRVGLSRAFADAPCYAQVNGIIFL
jgi:hypothetical protein